MSSALSYAAKGHCGRPARGAHIASLDVPPSRYWGAGRIAGTVKIIDTPAPFRRVRLYEKASGTLARETTSDGAGLYAFENVDTSRSFYVTAEDTGSTPYNATIEDFVVPSP